MVCVSMDKFKCRPKQCVYFKPTKPVDSKGSLDVDILDLLTFTDIRTSREFF